VRDVLGHQVRTAIAADAATAAGADERAHTTHERAHERAH
jgi:hypothetical protein